MFGGDGIWFVVGAQAMNTSQVTIVRVYFHTGDRQADALVKRLRDWEKVRGVSVFQGALGFGETRSEGASEKEFDEPTVIEFFDDPEKINTLLEHIADSIEPRHMVWWPATVHVTP